MDFSSGELTLALADLAQVCFVLRNDTGIDSCSTSILIWIVDLTPQRKPSGVPWQQFRHECSTDRDRHERLNSTCTCHINMISKKTVCFRWGE